ncbi:MAG: hypothetical protein QM679_02600 [Patulibacter sp.]
MTEPASTPDDEQPTGSFEPVTGDAAVADAELPRPGAPVDPGGDDIVAQIERLAQDRPEALIGGAFAIGFAVAMVVRRLVR